MSQASTELQSVLIRRGQVPYVLLSNILLLRTLLPYLNAVGLISRVSREPANAAFRDSVQYLRDLSSCCLAMSYYDIDSILTDSQVSLSSPNRPFSS